MTINDMGLSRNKGQQGGTVIAFWGGPCREYVCWTCHAIFRQAIITKQKIK
jgi:hypothetical protein